MTPRKRCSGPRSSMPGTPCKLGSSTSGKPRTGWMTAAHSPGLRLSGNSGTGPIGLGKGCLMDHLDTLPEPPYIDPLDQLERHPERLPKEHGNYTKEDTDLAIKASFAITLLILASIVGATWWLESIYPPRDKACTCECR